MTPNGFNTNTFILEIIGDKVKVDNDPMCDTFMGVGQCVHDKFLDVSPKSNFRYFTNQDLFND